MTTRQQRFNARQSPTDLDDVPVKLEVVLQFNYARNITHTGPSWPARHHKMKFGPSLIDKALKAGLYVLCSLPDVPGVWAVDDSHWAGPEILEVHCLQGWKVPDRIWTATTLKGVKL